MSTTTQPTPKDSRYWFEIGLATALFVIVGSTFVSTGIAMIEAGKKQQQVDFKLQGMAQRSEAHMFAVSTLRDCVDMFTNRVTCAANVRSLAESKGLAFAEKVDEALADIGLIQ
jgi:hypothetical protein